MDRSGVPLAPTVASLHTDLRRGLDMLRRAGFRAVQLAASGENGMRPRTMSASEVRDVALTLRRQELQVAGLDLWIPPDHFTDQVHVDRAIAAVEAAADLLAQLPHGGRGAISITLSDVLPHADIMQTLVASAHATGVRLAVLGPDPADLPTGCVPVIDPPDWLVRGWDPVAAASDPTSVPRLCDRVGGMRAAPAADGELDVQAYRVTCEVADSDRAVVADLRGLPDAVAALRAMQSAW